MVAGRCRPAVLGQPVRVGLDRRRRGAAGPGRAGRAAAAAGRDHAHPRLVAGVRAARRRVRRGLRGNREIWFGHKHITICHRSGGCVPAAQPRGVVSLDPSWSPRGATLVFARLSASGPFGPRGHAYFSPSWVRRWEATSRLWQVNADGSGPRILAAAGPGAIDPVFGRGGALLFVRDDSLWLLRPGAAAATRVTGPLGALSQPALGQAYCGYVPYPQLFAWTRALPGGTAGTS